MSETSSTPETPQKTDTHPLAPLDKENVTEAPATEPETPPAEQAPETTAETTAETAKPAEKPAAATSRAKKIGGILLDTALVLVLVGAIGATGYYLKAQYERFRVPTPMELVMQENVQLCQKHEELREKAFRAEEQIYMRKRLAHQEARLGQNSQQIADLEASIAEQRSRVLAIQHEIRSADKECRSVARSLLPGMPIGNATTTTGKAYRNAVIYRIDNKNIVLRTPEGQSRFPVRQLVKDNLPTLARYAFGLEDLVDMSDFDTADSLGTTTPAPQKSAVPAPKAPARAEVSYEPEPTGPVVDTDASDTSTTGDSGNTAQPDDGLAPW